MPAGESAEAVLRVSADAFLRFDPALERRAVVDGSHLLRVAVNAQDTGDVLTVEVVGEPRSCRRHAAT